MDKIKGVCKHIPNALTVLRFIIIPFIVITIAQDKYIEAFIFLTLSAITDVLDRIYCKKI